MKGLLQRAQRKRTSQINKSDLQTIDPVKVEIFSKIDQMIDNLKNDAAAVSTDFSVTKNDVVLPLTVLIGSIIILIGSGIFFLSFYNSKEKTILTNRDTVLSAESKILEAVKAESEEQLELRDQRISSIQNQLSKAIEDRNRLKEDTEQTLNIREEELRKAMEETLETERAKLEEQGLSSGDIQKRISEISIQLETENQSEMSILKEQYEKELAEKEMLMSEKIEEYQKNIDQFENEQNRLEEMIKQKEIELSNDFIEKSTTLEDQTELVLSQLNAIENVSARESLVSSQIMESYRSIENQIEKKAYEDALAEIENLENFLKQDSVLDLPGIERRLSAENFIITTLRNSISMKKTIEEVFPREKAVLINNENYLEKKLQSRDQLLLEAELKEKERMNLLLKLSDLQSDYRNSEGLTLNSSEHDQKEIIGLLDTKVTLKQIVSTEPIKSQYPDLLDQLELYFTIFGNNQKGEGRSELINEINSLLESLNSSSSSDEPWEAKIANRKDLSEILDNLKELLN